MYCPHCGIQLGKRCRQCTSCGKDIPQAQGEFNTDSLEHVLPINTDPVALFAGYFGLCGFFLCGFPGPISLVLGIWALKRLQDHPGSRGHVRAWVGILLGLVQTVVGGLFLFSLLGSP